VTRTIPTSEFASLVYGPRGAPLDDPAEEFHEASRLYPHVAPGRLGTILELVVSPDLQQTIARASRLHRHRAGVDLPRRALPNARFRELLHRRTSSLPPRREPLRAAELGDVLACSYGATSRADGALRRPVPSGGALYPLELYVLPLAVDGVETGAFHYDPYGHRLERLGAVDEAVVAAALVEPELAGRASALVVVTATFWRSRFKYGLRGYRFALLEAGHLVQNLLLAAAAFRLGALPLGGFYDRRLEALVGADGLHEAAVYAVLLGGAS
jgi:SagB-type dehydrogenase family enzyme